MGDLWLSVDWLRVLVDRARRMVARRESTLASSAVISDVPFSSSSCPIRRTTHGPRAEGQSRPAVGAAPQAAPAPVVGPLDGGGKGDITEWHFLAKQRQRKGKEKGTSLIMGFTWATGAAECEIEAEARGGGADPDRWTARSATLNTLTQFLECRAG